MQSGELIVTGKDSINIVLDRMPSEIKVFFRDEVELIPCNTHNVDYLEYNVHTSITVRSGFILSIKWSVSGVREIVWHALY